MSILVFSIILFSSFQINANNFGKPIKDLDIFVSNNIQPSYYAIKDYLVKDCLFYYGSNRKQGIINFDISEFNFLELVKRSNTQVFCNIEYPLLDKNFEAKNENFYLVFNVCNGILTSLDVDLHFLDVKDFGKKPPILDFWLNNYLRSFENNPKEETEVKEEESLGKKEVYDTYRIYWSNEIIENEDTIEQIFISSYFKKNQRFKYSEGSVSLSFSQRYTGFHFLERPCS